MAAPPVAWPGQCVRCGPARVECTCLAACCVIHANTCTARVVRVSLKLSTVQFITAHHLLRSSCSPSVVQCSAHAANVVSSKPCKMGPGAAAMRVACILVAARAPLCQFSIRKLRSLGQLGGLSLPQLVGEGWCTRGQSVALSGRAQSNNEGNERNERQSKKANNSRVIVARGTCGVGSG